jgi:GT2 family glycosyltransferase
MANFFKIYIIIANYKTWADTIECLESILRNNYPKYQIVIFDDYSANGSLDYIKAWADGKLNLYLNQANPLRTMSFPPVLKPVPYICYSRSAALEGGNAAEENRMEKNCRKGICYPLILIESEQNLGFAAGNNCGMAYALSKDDFEYVWLLNNDTVVAKDSLVHLVERARLYEAEGRKVCIIGTKLLYYATPTILQGVGGRFNKIVASSKRLGAFEEDEGQYDLPDIKMDYVIGASMYVDKRFLKDIGLMCTDYYLYFEELDWIFRGEKKGWNLGYAWQSKVFHKEGASVGSVAGGMTKSKLADYYALKNRIVITKKYFPQYLWSVYLGFIVVIWRRIKRKQFDRIRLVIKAMLQKPV